MYPHDRKKNLRKVGHDKENHRQADKVSLIIERKRSQGCCTSWLTLYYIAMY